MFTDRARKVMALANGQAQLLNHEYIRTEHILLGLVKEGSGMGANILKSKGVDLRKVRIEVEKLIKSNPDMQLLGKPPQTLGAKLVLEYAIEEARNLNHNYVGTEHILLGLIRENDGVAAQVLMNMGLKLEEVRATVVGLASGTEQQAQTPAIAAPHTSDGSTVLPEMLDKLGTLDASQLYALMTRAAIIAKTNLSPARRLDIIGALSAPGEQ